MFFEELKLVEFVVVEVDVGLKGKQFDVEFDFEFDDEFVGIIDGGVVVGVFIFVSKKKKKLKCKKVKEFLMGFLGDFDQDMKKVIGGYIFQQLKDFMVLNFVFVQEVV